MEAANSRNRIVCTIGIIVGALIIIIGLFSLVSLGAGLGQEWIQFGGDYYTEMYFMSYKLGVQIQKVYNAICWLIVVIGVFIVCYFAKGLCSINNDYLDIMQPPLNGLSEDKLDHEQSSGVSVSSKSLIIGDGKWLCGNCQTENSLNYGQCKKCGKFRT